MKNFPHPKLISFRNEIPEIKNTGYLTHSLFFHPAKFIPQVVRFCLKNYTPKGGTVLDPFGGSGTVGLEASIHGNESYLLEINPLMSLLHPLKFPILSVDEYYEIYRKSCDMLEWLFQEDSSNQHVWENLSYWYPPTLHSLFSCVWNKYHKIQEKNVKSFLGLALIKISKKYSFAEHNMPKLFTSKRKREWINEFLKKDDHVNQIMGECIIELNKIKETIITTILSIKLNAKVHHYYGIDSYEFDYSKINSIDSIITSPPYLQAQEYIRTFKMELQWLGHSLEDVNSFKKLEIPFRKAQGRIDGEYINLIRKRVLNQKLLPLFDSYFWYTIKVLEFSSRKLAKKGKMCVFVGNPNMDGVEIEIWKVILEYFVENLDYKFIDIFDDQIVARKLFNGRKNKSPNGMKSEYMLVLEKQK